MIIRKEIKSDYDEVYALIKASFASAEHSDGTEQDLVVRLRNSEEFIPELSLVAEDANGIIGHILFTKAKVNNADVLALAPLSVLPSYQRKGIGTALIKEGHNIAKELGYDICVVLGSSEYYPRLGYTKASEFGIAAPFPVPAENFMAISLNNNKVMLNAQIEYSKAFFE